ncbi:MAG TPA: copper resistance protein NlpE [Balneolaceae bacterium]|nr:copper resistance protein NlpE [Balneolaceae bacterium]
MKHFILFLFIAGVVSGCSVEKDEVQIIPDDKSLTEAVSGIWQGTIPCADCPGIQYELKLKPDHNYVGQSIYLGEDVEPFIEKGHWEIREDSIITLKKGTGKRYFKFTGEVIKMLDRQKQPITSELAEFYILERKTFNNYR